MALPELSVIIPFHGAKSDLINCLKGLQNQDSEVNFETIVVESGNDFGIREIMESINNSVLVSCGSVMYPGRARNIGIEKSRSELLAFIDADCCPSSNWIDEIYNSLRNGNKIVIGPVINLYPFHPVASVDNMLQFPDFQKYTKSGSITHFPACNLGITKELALSSGRFPEDVVTGEDVIFSGSALRKNGGQFYFNRNLIVRHSGRKDIQSFTAHNRSLGFHRGYLSLKITKNYKNRESFLFAVKFGLKRLFYISARTLQWNPVGLLRLLFYFPVVILGLSAWVSGFWRGNQKYMKEQFGKKN